MNTSRGKKNFRPGKLTSGRAPKLAAAVLDEGRGGGDVDETVLNPVRYHESFQ